MYMTIVQLRGALRVLEGAEERTFRARSDERRAARAIVVGGLEPWIATRTAEVVTERVLFRDRP
jgi:hypothetical protein